MMLTRIRLRIDAPPLDVLRQFREKSRLVALIGPGWSHGEALIAFDPSSILDSDGDPFDVVDSNDVSEPRFFGGWLGYWGYRLNRRLEHIPDEGIRDLILPDHQLGYYECVLRLDCDQHWYAEGIAAPEVVERYAREIEDLLTRESNVARPFELEPFASQHGRRRHLAAVAAAQEHIAAGDIFQVNLCDRYDSRLVGDPLDVFEQGTSRLGASYGAYVRWPGGAIASFSPELYLRRTGDRLISSPIKGTAPRQVDRVADAQTGATLKTSEKDVAENVMIVDLVRNDLAGVCVPGTVQVPRLCAAEAHAVWHLTSDVEGELSPDAGSGAALKATFPPGSITGAPKHEAMRVIDKLESHTRQAYTGGIGRASRGGMELNVAIRTLEFGRSRSPRGLEGGKTVEWVVHLGAGSAITTASEPTAEWSECRAKVAPIAEALGTHLAPEEHPCQPDDQPSDLRPAAAAPSEPAEASRSVPAAWIRPSKPRSVNVDEPRVVFIDNYDSFVHNLVDMVAVAGARTRVIRNDELTVEELVDQQRRGMLTHLVVSPGPGTPADAGISISAIRTLAPTTPIFGVCLGHQAIVEAFGGRVVRAPAPVHGRSEPVFHNSAGLWHNLPSPLLSARYHSLVADESTLPLELLVTARSSDCLVMGIEHRHLPIWGMQGHPESVLTARGVDLLDNFLSMRAAGDAARSRVRSRGLNDRELTLAAARTWGQRGA